MPIVRHQMGLQNMNNNGEFVRRMHVQFSQNLAKDAGKYLSAAAGGELKTG